MMIYNAKYGWRELPTTPKQKQKIIKESSWALTQEVNRDINHQIGVIKSIIFFLTNDVKPSPHLHDVGLSFGNLGNDPKKTVEIDLQHCNNLIKELQECYLDSGYQYDDDDTRNQTDEAGDTYYSNEKARTGSDKNRENEATTKFADIKENIRGFVSAVRQAYNEEFIQQLWPDDNPRHPEHQTLDDYMDNLHHSYEW